MSIFNNLIKIIYKDANNIESEYNLDKDLIKNNMEELKTDVMELFALIEVIKEHNISPPNQTNGLVGNFYKIIPYRKR